MNNVTLLHGDCLDLLPTLPAQSVDLILADLPYGTTACKWDSVLPLDTLWKEYKRVLKPRGAVVLTAAQPFTTTLISSNRAWFRYCWVWEKPQGTNCLSAAVMPLKAHEDICVFYQRKPIYNPQMTSGAPYKAFLTTVPSKHGEVYAGKGNMHRANEGTRYPKTVLHFPQERQGLHPTQKPVTLMAYLIRTYTDPGMTVLDNTMGSGTTGVAAVQEGRAFIGIEQDRAYYETACARIAAIDPLFQEVAS